MANTRIKDLPENTPLSGDWLVSEVQTSPGIYTTSKCHLSAAVANAGLGVGSWTSTHDTVYTLSGNWQSTTTGVATSAGNYWNSTYTTVSANSGRWSAAYNSILSYKSNWDNAFIGYHHPSTNITPITNGDLVIQATSNTQLTFKLKGSDGVVRTATLTLA